MKLLSKLNKKHQSQDHALASKLLKPTHSDHLYNFMRRIKEEMVIYEQTAELILVNQEVIVL